MYQALSRFTVLQATGSWGGGLGTRLHLWYVNYVLHLVGSIFQQECFSNRAKVKKHSVHLSELSQIKKIHVHLY